MIFEPKRGSRLIAKSFLQKCFSVHWNSTKRGCIHLQAEHIAVAKDRINRGVWHLQTADCRPQTADRRLQTADRRLQIADCKLKDSKNLPNKGETIKNITLCESEKVAWEQGWCFCAKLHWPHFQDAVGYSSPTRLFIDSPGILLIALILYSSLIIVNW